MPDVLPFVAPPVITFVVLYGAITLSNLRDRRRARTAGYPVMEFLGGPNCGVRRPDPRDCDVSLFDVGLEACKDSLRKGEYHRYEYRRTGQRTPDGARVWAYTGRHRCWQVDPLRDHQQESQS